MKEEKNPNIEARQEDSAAIPPASEAEEPKEASESVPCSEPEVSKPKKRGRPRKDATAVQQKSVYIKKKEVPSKKVSSTLNSADEKDTNVKVSPKKRGRPPKDKSDADDVNKKRGRPPTTKAKPTSGAEGTTSLSLDPASTIPQSIDKEKVTKSQPDSSTKPKAVKKATKNPQEISPSKRGRPKKEATLKVESISKRGKKIPTTSKSKVAVKSTKKS
jgi:hypothetical protein